uniref:G_PROTEIN_RECEP_F1_2 domain-containing protein n=1 Tax=Rhodnius prolixus TaxID=13249 RepID=T1HDZ7_RHOPR
MVFGGMTSTIQFVLPFIVVTFCYVRVSVKLNDRARSKPGAKTSRKEEVDRERKKRTNRMLIAMVTIFGVSWLPINLINVINDLYMHTSSWTYYNLFFFLSHAVAMSSTCYNPFLYAWLNDNFRKEFKQIS